MIGIFGRDWIHFGGVFFCFLLTTGRQLKYSRWALGCFKIPCSNALANRLLHLGPAVGGTCCFPETRHRGDHS